MDTAKKAGSSTIEVTLKSDEKTFRNIAETCDRMVRVSGMIGVYRRELGNLLMTVKKTKFTYGLIRY